MERGRSTPHSTILLVTFLLLVPAMVALGAEDGTPARSGGSRATEIDGQHRDNFDNDANLTLSDDAKIIDGELTLDRTVWYDDFNRVQLGPDWQVTSGTPRITASMLRTNATDIANASVRRAVGLHDLELFFELAPGLLFDDGPVIRLTATPPFAIWFKYTNSNRKLAIGHDNETGSHLLISQETTMQTDTFYRVTISVDGASISISLGGMPLRISQSVQGDFAYVELISLPRESAAWENMTLLKMDASGSALTDAISLPLDTYWFQLAMDRNTGPGMTLKVSLLDGADMRTLSGLGDILSNTLALYQNGSATYVDPTLVRSVRLEVQMSGRGDLIPSLKFWLVSWVGDPPVFDKPIPKITLKEDEPKADVLDLRGYFRDRFTPDDELTFSVQDVSDPLKVNPVVEGHNLSIQLPTRNWNGMINYRVRCSDGTLQVDSTVCFIEVQPVDDPPIVRPVPTQLVREDVPHTFNITDQLEDVDTPVEELSVRALSTHVTVDGQELTYFYDEGELLETVLVEVSDGTTTVTINITFVVEARDDPPAIGSIPEALVNEDEPRWVDLGQYFSDEDTPPANLTLYVVDGGSRVTVSGHRVYLNFTEGEGIYNFAIEVFDGTTSVTGNLRVRVVEMNDPPRFLKVGDVAVGDGVVELSVEEGATADYPITTMDDEGSPVTLSLLTDWGAATLEGATLRLVVPAGGIGVKELQVIASDGGLATTLRINVTVINKNDPPRSVAILSPKDNATFKTDETVNLRGTATDPDTPYGQVLNFTWYLDEDTLIGEGRERTVSNLSRGKHTVSLEVSDGIVSVRVTVAIVVEAKDGGGGNNGGNGGGGGDGGDDDGGGALSGAVLGGIVAAIAVAVVVAVLLAMRSRRSAGAGGPAARPAKGYPGIADERARAPTAQQAAPAKDAASEYEALYGAPMKEATKAEEQGTDDLGAVKTYEELYGENK